MPSPIYFCPHGVARPEHIAAAGAVETLPAAACGAGFVFGHGGWSDAMAPLLIASPHGWSAIIHGCEARHFLRLRPYDGTVIDGHPQRNDRWMVPLLLRPTADGMVCALPRTLGPDGWTVPGRIGEVQERLRALVEDRGEWDDAAVTDLSIDIMSVNYHVSRFELTQLGMIDETMVHRVIAAAAGIEAPHA